MFEILPFSIRCIETIIGISGLIMSLGKLKCKLKSFIAIYTIIALLALFIMVATLTLFGVGIAEKISVPLIFVASLVGLILCNEDNIYVSLFNLLTQLNVYFGVTCLTYFITHYFIGVEYFISYIIVRAIVFSLLILFNIIFVRKKFRYAVMFINKEWKIVCLISIAFFVQQVFLSIYPIMHYKRPSYNYIVIVISYVVMAVVYYIIYTTLNNLINNYEKNQQEALTKGKMHFLEEQINLQNKTMDTVKRQQHDLRHHCVAAIGLIREKNYDDAIRYLEQYCDKFGEGKITYYCEHSAINCILSSMAEKSKGLGINVEIETSVPQGLPADEVEIASICANSFENAIEGCVRISQEIEKKIHIVIKYKDGKLLIEVKNTCENDIEFNGEFPITKKEFGGVGTKSIAYIAKKYDGMVDFKVKDNVFTTRIILNIQ